MDRESFMRRALALAERGVGRTNPNPMVGCVIVKDGEIIGEGFHEKYGQFHAERNALLHCTRDPAGADLYVTLEPCCHYGKTPPCTEIIIEKRIARVFVGSTDPNPLVAGNGIRILREAGIEVETGLLEAECRLLNEVFYHFITTGMPFTAMKYAMTLDGKIAAVTGDSKWITGEAARRQVHGLRRRYAAILVGIGTVIADDPMLNCRIAEGADPVRVVCDSSLRIPAESKLVRTAREIPTIVACTRAGAENQAKADRLREAGIGLIVTDGSRVDLRQLMAALGERKLDSVLLEGGGTLNAAALEAGIVNRVYAYIAPKLIGGRDAPSPIRGAGIPNMADAVTLERVSVQMLDGDICISGYPIRKGA